LNDEPPRWIMDEPVPYTAVVERDPQPGQLIFQFLAEDPDTNSEIMYTLHSKSPNTSRLIMKDGKIFTESGPSFKYDTYKILVSANDIKAVNRYGSTNNKSQEIFAELIIHVGKRAPQFYQSEYKINISESAPIGYLVANMRAKSFNPDPFNKKHLRYSLLTKQNQQSAEFSIYSENGTVILTRKVDYETDQREYNLIVTVSEQSGWLFSSSTRLNIYIEDANDNPPQFTLSEYVKNTQVPEDIPSDTFIIAVEVQDRDSGLNSEIEWSLSNSNFYVKPFSDGDTKRAKIYNKGRLDYEIPQHVYRFDVIACDKGKEPLCANAKVSVPMSNVNDEKPRFDMKVITSVLDENVPPGTFVTTITATDDDGDRVFFSLKDETSPFEINRESGIVKIKNDRRIDAKQDYYNLTVFADDDGSCCCHNGKQKSVVNYASACSLKTNREEAILVIKINDINDHAPKFIDCDSYSRLAQVEEEMPIGTNVTQVVAYDEDKGQNGEVEYEIISTNHNNEKTL
jgi:protocadherin delta 1